MSSIVLYWVFLIFSPVANIFVSFLVSFPCQDLLKHTPASFTPNDERISLQLALTHLEALTDSLNERKREHEQEKSARGVLKWSKIPAGYRHSTTGSGDAADNVTRRVLAEDDFKELVSKRHFSRLIDWLIDRFFSTFFPSTKHPFQCGCGLFVVGAHDGRRSRPHEVTSAVPAERFANLRSARVSVCLGVRGSRTHALFICDQTGQIFVRR